MSELFDFLSPANVLLFQRSKCPYLRTIFNVNCGNQGRANVALSLFLDIFIYK